MANYNFNQLQKTIENIDRKLDNIGANPIIQSVSIEKSTEKEGWSVSYRSVGLFLIFISWFIQVYFIDDALTRKEEALMLRSRSSSLTTKIDISRSAIEILNLELLKFPHHKEQISGRLNLYKLQYAMDAAIVKILSKHVDSGSWYPPIQI